MRDQFIKEEVLNLGHKERLIFAHWMKGGVKVSYEELNDEGKWITGSSFYLNPSKQAAFYRKAGFDEIVKP